MEIFNRLKDRHVQGKKLEEAFFEMALDEIATGEKRPGLWGQAIAQSDGNMDRANAVYVGLLANSIKDDYYIHSRANSKLSNSVTSSYEEKAASPSGNSKSGWKGSLLALGFIFGLMGLVIPSVLQNNNGTVTTAIAPSTDLAASEASNDLGYSLAATTDMSPVYTNSSPQSYPDSELSATTSETPVETFNPSDSYATETNTTPTYPDNNLQSSTLSETSHVTPEPLVSTITENDAYTITQTKSDSPKSEYTTISEYTAMP